MCVFFLLFLFVCWTLLSAFVVVVVVVVVVFVWFDYFSFVVLFVCLCLLFGLLFFDCVVFIFVDVRVVVCLATLLLLLLLLLFSSSLIICYTVLYIHVVVVVVVQLDHPPFRLSHKAFNSFRRIMNSLESREASERILVFHLAVPAHKPLRFRMPQRRHVRTPYDTPMAFLHLFRIFARILLRGLF